MPFVLSTQILPWFSSTNSLQIDSPKHQSKSACKLQRYIVVRRTLCHDCGISKGFSGRFLSASALARNRLKPSGSCRVKCLKQVGNLQFEDDLA